MALCEPWEIDESCLDLPEDTDIADLLERWQGVASQILYDASGKRYGLCEITVRPCLRSCGGGSFVPYKGSDGAWRNFATCGCLGDCSCVELCEIVLPGPVDSVVQVLIDGTELEDTNYRLDLVNGQYRLLRTDGGCWPACSDITADCEDEDSFCVTYMQGIALDALAIAAVSELTSELVKACIPNCKTCRLPKNAIAVTRRGVTLTFDNTKTWLRVLPLVGAFLDATNPNNLVSASSVWSPDVPQTRVTPTPAGS